MVRQTYEISKTQTESERARERERERERNSESEKNRQTDRKAPRIKKTNTNLSVFINSQPYN